MKKIFLLAVGLMMCINQVKAQDIQSTTQCDFQKNLTFKNGVDTIVILAYKTELVRIGPMLPSLAKLTKLKKIKYKMRSGIAFKPVNCPDEIVADCIDQHSFSYTMHPGDEKKVFE